MERSALRLIPSSAAPAGQARVRVVVLVSWLCGMGIAATLLGADAARERGDPRDVARGVLARMTRGESTEATLRSDLLTLRDRAVGLPLDAPARAAYASTVAATALDQDALEVATFHARIAVRLAPVTVPVVRAAALVLAQAGHTDEAVDCVRNMFGYEPNAAARLLSILEPQLSAQAVRSAMDDLPRAWLARAAVLLGEGRQAEAVALVAEGVERWPDDLDLRTLAAAQATAVGDWVTAAALLPDDLDLPDAPASAVLLVYRARVRAAVGNPAGASGDLDRAMRLAGESPLLLLQAGDGWLELDRPDRARESWNRSLYVAPPDATTLRVEVLRRVARLDEHEGRGGTALRLWREVLRLSPDDEEAEHRIEELAGGA